MNIRHSAPAASGQKIISIGLSAERWDKLKALANGMMRNVRQQATHVLVEWIDAQPPACWSLSPAEELAATVKRQMEG